MTKYRNYHALNAILRRSSKFKHKNEPKRGSTQWRDCMQTDDVTYYYLEESKLEEYLDDIGEEVKAEALEILLGMAVEEIEEAFSDVCVFTMGKDEGFSQSETEVVDEIDKFIEDNIHAWVGDVIRECS